MSTRTVLVFLILFANAADSDGRPVFTLAFHVDYWNHLGWTDPFSAAAYSQRQQDYSKSFGLNRIYTPQMIVNGKKEFVGSDKQSAEAAIAESLATRNKAAVTVKASGKAAGGWKVFIQEPGNGQIIGAASVPLE